MTAMPVYLDPVRSLDLPVVEAEDPTPDWVAQRGGDCRAFDLRLDRPVFGPHPFRLPEDIRLTNGILRVDVCDRRDIAHVTVSAFKDGAWRAKGHVYFSDVSILLGARLVSVTPERVTAALDLAWWGELRVRLCRGERAIRVQHGLTRSPSINLPRLIQWRDAPPPPADAEDWGMFDWGTPEWGGAPGSPPAGPVNGSPVILGIEYEATVEGGVIGAPDAHGLVRGLYSPRATTTKPIGMGLAMTTDGASVRYAAFLSTAAVGDDLGDLRRQLTAENEQEVRVR